MTSRRKYRPRPEGEAPDVKPEPRVLSAAEQREQLMMYAFRALGQRALSEAELRGRMLRRLPAPKLPDPKLTEPKLTDPMLADAELTGPELVNAVLERVRELGYLNDEQVAQAEARRRGVGSGRVRQKLRQRGVENQLIEEVLAERDPEAEAEDARTLLARRWPSFQRAPDPQRRAFAFMLRRGYSSSMIWPLLREVAAEYLAEQKAAGQEEEEPTDWGEETE